jgi:hypothetical protein
MNQSLPCLRDAHPAEAILASELLWPDPFAAPDVPPRKSLLAALTDPNSVPPWLVAQIARSVQCQRALAVLEAVDLLRENDRQPLRDVRFPSLSNPRVGVVSEWFAHMLCSTRSVIPFFAESRLGWQQSGNPPDVLLVSGPFEVDGIRAWKGYLCNLANEWPDELPLPDQTMPLRLASGLDFLVHAGIQCDVAEGQLYGSFGTAQASIFPTPKAAPSAPPCLAMTLAVAKQRLLQGALWLESGLLAERKWRRSSRGLWQRIAAESGTHQLDVAPSFREVACADLPPEVRLSALTDGVQRVRFEIINRELVLDIIPWPEGKGCSVWILGADGKLTPTLDGAVIFNDSGQPSSPVQFGETEVEMHTPVRGFALVDAEGQRLPLEALETQ